MAIEKPLLCLRIVAQLWPEANQRTGLKIDSEVSKVDNLKYEIILVAKTTPYAAVHIKSGYNTNQSSWISTALNSIAELYGLNDHRSASERLVAVNESLRDDAFIYRDSDRGLPLRSLPMAMYRNFMYSWNLLDHRMQEKAVLTVRNALKIKIRSSIDEDDKAPVVHTESTRELDPAVMEAFRGEPLPSDPDLGPLVMPNARKDFPKEGEIPQEGAIQEKGESQAEGETQEEGEIQD
ncbi:hypothetical protein BZA05DRAFT_416229 [Tricharina praecox]|uniref:uncharacterized protein n=1 Tax=Tricharina praecox TaxID=43433 RepID=UPI00221FA2B4|nr:uncharacterized protein BZA05DRAFT_416229 [Tricharina praecox]KAI5856575.1 hypothetical protein BZA05DRAFT_416229 [Tricharina praecox]